MRISEGYLTFIYWFKAEAGFHVFRFFFLLSVIFQVLILFVSAACFALPCNRNKTGIPDGRQIKHLPFLSNLAAIIHSGGKYPGSRRHFKVFDPLLASADVTESGSREPELSSLVSPDIANRLGVYLRNNH